MHLQIAVADTVLPPLEFMARRNSAGAFSGMAFARYDSVAMATKACRMLDGVTLAGRQIQAEFKRPDPAQQKRVGSMNKIGSPRRGSRDGSPNEDRAQREIEEKLRAFVNAKDQVSASIDFPPSLSSSLRKYVHTTAAGLGLHHTSEKRDAGQRFVRVRKGPPPTSPSPPSSVSGSLIEERVYETTTPASIRNDMRSSLSGCLARSRADSTGRDRRRPTPLGSSFGGGVGSAQSAQLTKVSRSLWPQQQQRGRSDSFGLGPVDAAAGGAARARSSTLGNISHSAWSPGSSTSKPIEIVRPPRGPDGTRGFHARSPAKASCPA